MNVVTVLKLSVFNYLDVREDRKDRFFRGSPEPGGQLKVTNPVLRVRRVGPEADAADRLATPFTLAELMTFRQQKHDVLLAFNPRNRESVSNAENKRANHHEDHIAAGSLAYANKI